MDNQSQETYSSNSASHLGSENTQAGIEDGSAVSSKRKQKTSPIWDHVELLKKEKKVESWKRHTNV
ncbi:hypothetical protein KXD40_000672 [Peronospora effusa]|nr:hypothetical protein KXD40_000672 [Peronospora effusa]